MSARLLMCPPTHFGVEYVINPWMQGQVGRTVAPTAAAQWMRLHAFLAAEAEVTLLDPVAGLPDMPFVANAGLVLGRTAVPARFRCAERQGEERHFTAWFRRAGFRVVALDPATPFEGEGDARFQPGAPLLWAGYGTRSSLEAHPALGRIFDVEVVSLRLVDPRFYHLDTCLAPLDGGRLLWYPPAFDEPSRAEIARRVPAARRFAVDEADALRFVCNAVQVGSTVVVNAASPAFVARLAAWGLRVVCAPLDQFLLAGGGAKCLVLDLLHDVPADPDHAPVHPRFPSPIRHRQVELRGHLLDGGVMSGVLDSVGARGGFVEVEEFRAGPEHRDESRARLRIVAPSGDRLDDILDELARHGATVLGEPADARLEVVTLPGVAPDDFHSTTIYPTDVRIGGRWVRAARQRMDAVLVVAPTEPPAVRCTLLRDLVPGDRVVCGGEGVRIDRPPTVDDDEAFAFMSAGVSSERKVERLVEQVAAEMRALRARGERIVVVAGPVVIHTGGGPHLARLIRGGFVQALLGGNAVAVHDLELALYGTSLGVDMERGTAVHDGHQHHIRTINLIRRHGGIAQAVAAGVVRSGVMYECVTHGVPFVLAGSIRDDGPLPETRMDLVAAQDEYAAAIEGAGMVLMLSSMLHAIGAGNMTPAGVRLVCVDISPAVATKLNDRGSLESTGIVTDVGLFLHLLARSLCPQARAA